MTEIKDCLPEAARKHFINLRNIRLGSRNYFATRERLTETSCTACGQEGKVDQAGKRWKKWKYKEELSDALAIAYVKGTAIETCELYEIPLTEPLCECLAKATDEMLDAQYRNALQAQAQEVSDVKIPLSVRQQGNMRAKQSCPRSG